MKILMSLAAAALLTLTGCLNSEDAGAKNDLTEQARNAIEARKDYEAALAKWNAAGVADYAFQVNMGCFCFPMGWMNVYVEASAVVKVDPVPGKDLLYEPDQFGLAPTVEHLFHIVNNHLGSPDYTVGVQYDARLGYPRTIDIKNHAELLDADYDIEVTSLAPAGRH